MKSIGIVLDIITVIACVVALIAGSWLEWNCYILQWHWTAFIVAICMVVFAIMGWQTVRDLYYGE
ncbi:hypothetical protein [Paucilactobacillus sp. N302-9]